MLSVCKWLLVTLQESGTGLQGPRRPWTLACFSGQLKREPAKGSKKGSAKDSAKGEPAKGSEKGSAQDSAKDESAKGSKKGGAKSKGTKKGQEPAKGSGKRGTEKVRRAAKAAGEL